MKNLYRARECKKIILCLGSDIKNNLAVKGLKLDHDMFRPIEIPFGDKDQVGDYTMQAADIVEFYIATDRRDQLQRATNIVLVDDTFLISGEKREKVAFCLIIQACWHIDV